MMLWVDPEKSAGDRSVDPLMKITWNTKDKIPGDNPKLLVIDLLCRNEYRAQLTSLENNENKTNASTLNKYIEIQK